MELLFVRLEKLKLIKKFCPCNTCNMIKATVEETAKYILECFMPINHPNYKALKKAIKKLENPNA